jgi:heterotetrameric sarcosine oxidase gamma subunit
MPEPALGHLLKPGRYPGAGGGASGLVIQERPNVAQIQVIARKDRDDSLARRLSALLGTALAPLEGAETDAFCIYATGPREYWVFSETLGADALERRLGDELGDTASLFDQSHVRIVVGIRGDGATGLLAQGTNLDLGGGAPPAPGASHTALDHVPALVVRRAERNSYNWSVPRSYAGSFVAWFSEAALEFGYTVEAMAD